jgi:hypothetical protein
MRVRSFRDLLAQMGKCRGRRRVSGSDSAGSILKMPTATWDFSDGLNTNLRRPAKRYNTL